MDRGLQWIRRRERALARAVLALFCLAWLQVAAVPCAMAHAPAAAEVSDGHCLYCPTEPSPAPACDELGGCGYPHEPRVDARAVAPLFVAVPASILPALAPAAGGEYRAPSVALPQAVPRPPFSVSYCRFIE